jgi:transcriptional regulator with XRE-family HTH domain
VTGDQIHALRESLGLSHATFAAIFGVNASTIYRWEAHGEAHARVEGLSHALVYLLAHRARTGAPAALGATLTDAIARGGTLEALSVLLSEPSTEVSG